jgi:hypothetical protein
MKTIPIANQKREVGKTTCPKGIFTEDKFMETMKAVDRERKLKRSGN